MAALAVGQSKTHPWWAVAAAVSALIDVAGDTAHPLSDPALAAVQIMATRYNAQTAD